MGMFFNNSGNYLINSNDKKRKNHFILSDFVLPGLHKRINKARKEWLIKSDNSLNWNDWAKINPNTARDICLEAEYFYGDSKILPIDWKEVINASNKSCEAVIDDGSYKPKIFDDPENGQIKIAGLGFEDK